MVHPFHDVDARMITRIFVFWRTVAGKNTFPDRGNSSQTRAPVKSLNLIRILEKVMRFNLEAGHRGLCIASRYSRYPCQSTKPSRKPQTQNSHKPPERPPHLRTATVFRRARESVDRDPHDDRSSPNHDSPESGCTPLAIHTLSAVRFAAWRARIAGSAAGLPYDQRQVMTERLHD